MSGVTFGSDDNKRSVDRSRAAFEPAETGEHPKPDPPRLVRRNLAFNQSHNVVSFPDARSYDCKRLKWACSFLQPYGSFLILYSVLSLRLVYSCAYPKVQVNHNQGHKIASLVHHDWFHVLLRRRTWESLLGLTLTWTFFIVIFACFYMLADRQDPAIDCGFSDDTNSTLPFCMYHKAPLVSLPATLSDCLGWKSSLRPSHNLTQSLLLLFLGIMHIPNSQMARLLSL